MQAGLDTIPFHSISSTEVVTDSNIITHIPVMLKLQISSSTRNLLSDDQMALFLVELHILLWTIVKVEV